MSIFFPKKLDIVVARVTSWQQFHHQELHRWFKSPKLEAALDIVHAQLEKYGTDFDASMSNLDEMVVKKGNQKSADEA